MGATVDWGPFHRAFRAGLPNADRLQAIHRIEKLLELTPAEALPLFQKEMASSPARPLYQNLVLLNFTIQREIGIAPGPDANAAVQKLMQEAQQGVATEERRNAAIHLYRLYELAGALIQKDPSVTQPPSPEELESTRLQQAGMPIFARAQAVAGETSPGTVTHHSIGELESAIRDAQALIAGTASGNHGLAWLFYMTGATVRTLGGCYAIAGRNSEAIAAYGQAAEYFTKAGAAAEVEDAQSRAKNLERKLSGELDSAAEKPLETLSEAVTGGNPLDRIQALMQLVDVAGSAGDTFEAREKAEAAAAALEQIGYIDPDKSDAATAMNTWIRVAAQSLQGVPLLGRLTQVGMWCDSILGARYAVLVGANPAAADALNKLQSSLQILYVQANQEAQAAHAEDQREWARYFPAPAARQEEKKREDKKNGQDFTTYMEACRKIDEALAQIRNVCNERASTPAPMDDLLGQLHELQAQADLLNTPEYEAKTRLEEAYVLGHAGRAADIVPVAQEARTRLLAGRPAKLSSFSQSHQRYLYLDSLTREMQGRMMSGDLEGGFKIGESVIQDFESERYRVNNEFRQSALLSYVADFYTWTALAAFKLHNWDAMLATIDLIKARSAVRNRLIPDPPELFESKTAREFEELSDSGAAGEELKERRRQLWDLLSIARGQSSGLGQLPELTLPALQAALSSDEALIAYFWLNDTVLLSIAIDNARFHAERIILNPGQAKLLNGFVAFIQGLKSSHNMDKQIAKLGDILLPAFLRDFMREKKRVIFSPHRGLHLFPFHAARWDGAFAGTQFAVSYAPNFSSILLPWSNHLDNRVLAIGIKEFANPAVRPLLNVEDDVRAIQTYYEANGVKVEVLLGPEATRQRLEALRNSGDLSKFRCVHLGTHGLSVFETPNQPLESSLLVQNGALDAMDIANLRLNAELVVLNACHSGQRAIELRNLGAAPGDDIFGLQAALFKSGVRSILGTLWLVETESASAITREFHRNYGAGDAAEVALQKSVKAYVADASALRGAFYWAPYFISSLGRQPKGENKAWRN